MKSCIPILVLALGLGGALLSGCATATGRPHRAAAEPLPPAQNPEAPSIASDGLWPDDFIDDASQPGAKGNPTALAHYAAGISYEWNDEDELAVQQFYQAALADPANERLAIKVAQRYLKTKAVDKAVTVLANCARRRDASGNLYSWLARAHLQAGKTNQALASSRIAIKRAPQSFDGYESQLEVYFHNNKTADALHTMNKAAKALHPDAPTLLSLGNFYLLYLKAQPRDNGARSNAVALLDRVAVMRFNAPRLWQNLGDMYDQMGQPKKAAAIYLKLLAETPESGTLHASLHEKLAGIYFQEEDRTNAMKQLEAIVRDNPTRYPRAWYFLGELAFEDNRLDDARDDYDNAIRSDPNYDEPYYKMALVQIAMHRTDDAFKTLAAAQERFPKSFISESYMGAVYMQLKNYPEAIRHFNEAEVIGQATTPAMLDYRFYFQFGEACERNQDYKRAGDYLQKCIDLSPQFSEALNYLGYMLADRGEQLPRARALIEKAVQLEPKNGAFLDSLGWVLFKQKQPQQALPWLLKALEFSPEPDATVLDHLGEVYMALHQPAKAIEAWKKSISIESSPEVKRKLDAYSGGA